MNKASEMTRGGALEVKQDLLTAPEVINIKKLLQGTYKHQMEGNKPKFNIT